MQQPSKKSKTKNLRNVLKNPFGIQWSEKKLDEVFPIQNLLKEVLPSAKLEETDQKITFNKRKEVSHNVLSKIRSPNINRSYLAIGFNHVIRSLEKGDLCCILVANDIQPPLLTKTLLAHVLGSGQWTGSGGSVPVLILPEFRNIARSTLGYTAMTIGLKNIAVNPDNIFNPVYKFVRQNPTILQYQVLTSSQEYDEELLDEVQPTEKKAKAKTSKALDFIPEKVYLYRKTKNERIFIPENAGKIETKKSGSTSDDFVSFEEKPASSKGACDFLSFGDTDTIASRVLTEGKPEISDSFELMEEDDDEDSSTDDEPAEDFFIDDKRDDSLIRTFHKEIHRFSVHDVKKDNTRKKALNVQPGISRMFQTASTTKKDLTKFEGKKMKKKLKNKVKVNYQPLRLKTITGNAKRVHRKSKL